MTELMPVREAQQRILAIITKNESELCAPEVSYRRVLAEDIRSPLRLPPFDNSSMDGFAVHSSDLNGATKNTPITLPVAFDIPAGASVKMELPSGKAARIFTGAPLPRGADAPVRARAE